MQLYTQSFPLIIDSDDVWISFRSYEALARIYVSSISDGATVQIASGPDNTPTNLGGPSTLTFTQAGTTQSIGIPIGGSVLNRVTRVHVTSGRVTIAVVSPSMFNCYSAAPVVTSFGI